jgi:hypothetical protein
VRFMVTGHWPVNSNYGQMADWRTFPHKLAATG